MSRDCIFFTEIFQEVFPTINDCMTHLDIFGKQY